MKEPLKQLRAAIGEAADLAQIIALLEWDQQTYMPKGAGKLRGQQLATLSGLAHQKITSPQIGGLLEELMPWAETLPADSDDRSLVEITARDYERAARVPAAFVSEMTMATSLAHQAWVEARAQSDFKIFQPHLEKIIELKRKYVSFFPAAAHPYDTLLDDYEPGIHTSEIQAIFQALRPQQVALLKEITNRPQVDDSFLHLAYDEQKQWNFGIEVASAFGYDWQYGRQDQSAHPFTTSFGSTDVRITTRVDKNASMSALFSTMHEVGHGLYEQGISEYWARTSLAAGASLSIHESQSRLWENIIGRSLPFWEHFYPRLQQYFPEQLGKISLEQFYRGINKVKPSLIRVEADEATYNLHIMLRLELEIGLIDGSIRVSDLPELWNAKMQEYLGLTPPNTAQGVLQDVHWSSGLVGYFATYSLGNLISAQLWDRYRQVNPEIENQMRRGEFSALRAWLQQEIHQYGRKYKPQELVQRITGSQMDPAPYTKYLTQKYSEIYQL